MSDDHSARLALPYLAAGQTQKHVTLNAALTRLDALVQTAAVSRTVRVQPAEAADGDLYILPYAAEGPDWSSRAAGSLMRFEGGGWIQTSVPVGLVVLVLDTATAVVRGEGGWSPLGQWLGELQALSRLGLGAIADAENPLAAKLNKALFAARGVVEGGTGDLRMTLNKEGADNVLSLLFQSGWSGRAELGLGGDEDLSLKVSADGETWRRVFGVDRTTGRIDFNLGATRRETTVFVGDGAYDPPAWARWIEAVVVGGGGGGGSGEAGTAGTERLGGGGGGAGGLARGRWATADLSSLLTITVGAGGVVGAGGGESRVELAGVGLLRAGGGAGGTAGQAGSGGWGQRQANGGGAPSVATTSASGATTTCADGPGGGGAGGGLDAANVARAGGPGGAGDWCGRRTAGGPAGVAGQVSSAPELSCVGGGGGGGNASANGAGGGGGPGAAFGAGGGGGGAGLTTAGMGGVGAGGVVRITAVG